MKARTLRINARAAAKARGHDAPVGQVFGRWTVQGSAERSSNGSLMWRCLCECGTVASVYSHDVRSGKSRSCGCLQRDVARTHGQHGTRTHDAWTNMKARCNSPKATGYEHYGGRGIKVCKRWDKFENFLADMGECPPGLTIERKNNEGNYCKSNCCWATQAEQQRNKRTAITGMYQGKRWRMLDLAREHGIKPSTAYNRIHRGQSFIAACTTPTKPKEIK